MDKDQYIELFEGLELYCQDRQGNEQPIETAYNAGRILRSRTTGMPPTYFNGKAGDVYFVTRLYRRHWYPANLWKEIEPQKRVDAKPNLITWVPIEGLERAAFERLMS